MFVYLAFVQGHTGQNQLKINKVLVVAHTNVRTPLYSNSFFWSSAIIFLHIINNFRICSGK